MRQNKFSLREQKFGDKRIEILDVFIKELETKMIQSISVDSICETAKISKVTFFNYFASKEEVLYYFIHKWQFSLSYDIETKKFSGASGIYHIFEAVTGEKYSLNFMLAIIQYFIKLDSPPKPMNISHYEYYSFNSAAFESNTPKRELCDLFIYYLEEMKCKNISTTVESLFSVFYGVPVLVHMMGKEAELGEKYRNAVSSIIFSGN